MSFKIIICMAAIFAVKAIVDPTAQLSYNSAPASSTYADGPGHASVSVPEDFDPNPQYTYGYDIQDDYTGDSKSHKETRQGDFVQGSYSLVDSDGHKRTVEYTADSEHGFNAVVHREPIDGNGVNDVAISGKTARAASAYSAYPDYGH